jgi:hypothetical protein
VEVSFNGRDWPLGEGRSCGMIGFMCGQGLENVGIRFMCEFGLMENERENISTFWLF